MANQIVALRDMVLQLIKGQEEQKKQAEEQRALYEKQAAELKAALCDESKKHGYTITLLEALSEKSARTPTYSEAAKIGVEQASMSQKTTAPLSQKGRPSTEAARKDERAVNIDTGRTKAEKTDFAVVKERL
jgi:hypothetical protein